MTSLQVRERPEWQPILHSSNQVVLYNPTSHALIIHPSSQSANRTVTLDQSVPHLCPYCSRPLPPGPTDHDSVDEQDSPFSHLSRFEDVSEARASNYFHLLQVANESASRPPSPPLHSTHSPHPSQTNTRASSPSAVHDDNVFSPESMAEGYFKAFFQEEARLGMGANGTVFLCQHVLNGNPLGHFAVKKIAVGQSASYLLKILREVHLLETLRHPNIITYHHAWLETAQFSTFGPKIPTLHVLMQWAEGGSLDDYIDARLGRPTHLPHPTSNDPSTDDDDATSEMHSRSARIRAFRAMQRAAPSEKSALRAKLSNNGHSWTAVHLLSTEEVLGIFGGVAAGLGFLHDKSILHLDLKPGNVLLTWDEGALIPRAMLSDFGTSRDMLQMPRVRSGNTGTLEYSSPESLPVPPHNTLPQTDSKSDMWSLGMILHKLIFFRLPYRWAAYGDRPLDGFTHASPHDDGGKGSDMDRLEREVSSYPGFKSTPRLETLFASRRLPRPYLVLLESLLNVSPVARPSCEKVLAALHLGKFNPIPPKSSLSDALASRTVHVSDTTATSSLVPALRLPTSTSPHSSPTLPQLTLPPSAPVSRPAPLPDSSMEKKRLPSPTRPMQGRWFAFSQRTSAWVLRALKSGVLALKIASLCINKEALPLWALSMLAGLSIVVDSLSDNVTLNLGMGIVHFVVLKMWRWRG
ncbi:kinase-like protein [Lactarius akahatsu]|uniref:non-specific serine/threonine protein kinase n=1 Tax=Lactarius akahatsu TaxID=416441 RepID=A0AAD4LD22_9AGAM|nr:kinase-like protein [Lactarius akahatsu]